MAQPSGTPTPQSEPLYKALHGKQDQVENKAGGYVFRVDDLKRALRFVIMGNESGKYYTKEADLQRENVKCVDRLIGEGQGVALVQLIKEVSVNRRNIKQGPLLLAYAICARSNDKDTKKAAYAILSDICRIPTHLFMFIKLCEEESSASGTGWGRAHKRAVCNWYTSFNNHAMKLAQHVTKYKQRESWSHRDVLRLAHLYPDEKCLAFILRYVVKGLKSAREFYLNDAGTDEATKSKIREISEYIGACDSASLCQSEDELCHLIETHKLSWEHCNSMLLKSPKVWRKLLPHMPVWAMVRNLGRMTSYGMFHVNSEEEQVCLDIMRTINQVIETPEEGSGEPVERMEVDDDDSGHSNREGAVKRRNVIHPFTILLGLYQYKHGKGEKGSLMWDPNKNIEDALEQAFYQAFEAITPTGKKFYLAVDVSGSMSQPCLGSSNIYCSTAAACMMMVTARTEENCIIKGFAHGMKDLQIDRTNDTLVTIQQKMNRLTFGSTDCAKPMMDAMENKIRDVDVFVVYTDNETWFGGIHPTEALSQYRQWSDRREAKLIVCGMCATEFSIADSADPGMLDIAGFDSSAPKIISEFAMGNL